MRDALARRFGDGEPGLQPREEKDRDGECKYDEPEVDAREPLPRLTEEADHALPEAEVRVDRRDGRLRPQDGCNDDGLSEREQPYGAGDLPVVPVRPERVTHDEEQVRRLCELTERNPSLEGLSTHEEELRSTQVPFGVSVFEPEGPQGIHE